MKKLRFVSLTLIVALLCNPIVMAFHAPPWDTGHNSFMGDPGDANPDPGTCDGECGSCPCTGKAMSPVEAASGNFIYTLRVLTISGLGPSIDVSLTYNSQDLHRGPFGVGWVNPYEQRIIETTDGTNNFAVYSLAEGKRERFKRNSDGTYTAPPRLFSKLTKNSDGTHTLRDKYGLVRRFNGQGQLTAIVDRNGNTLSLAYDTAGFMTTITDASGRAVKLTKGADGRVASMSDPANRTIRFAYDISGNLTRYTDPLGNNTTYQYDSANNMTAMVDPRGNTLMRLTYDNTGRVSQHFDGAETWTYTYSPSLKRTTKRDSQNNTWTFDYNDNGNVTKITDPFGKIELYVVDANLNVTQMTDKNGNITKYTYDALGNQLTVTDAQNNVRKVTYDAVLNRPLSIRDALGNTARFEYDAKGNLIKATDALATVTQFKYDAKGQLIQVIDAAGSIYTFQYNAAGDLVKTTDPLGNSSTATYNSLGQILTATDAKSLTTTFTYDNNLRLIRTLDANGGSTAKEYDASGNLISITLPSGAKTSFQYDFLNRRIRSTNPLGQSETYTYDRRDRLASKSDAKGQNVAYLYDALGRLTRKTKPDDTISYAYDSVGNLLTLNEGDTILTFVYDTLNRTTEARTAATAGQPATTIKFTYDANSNRKTMTDPSGGVTTYSYDGLLRMASITDPAGRQFTFSYDQLSRRTRVDRPLGMSTAYNYDAASRLTSLTHQGGPGTLMFTYTYDTVGNRITKSDRSGTRTYSYDQLYRLTGVSPLPGNPSETYSYDAIGNRTSLLTASTYDAANRLTSNATFDYVYDANGNLTRKTERSTGRITNYTYDSDDQLVRIDLPGGTTISYRYDGMGRRIEKNLNGQITKYVYDGQDILFEYTGTTFSARYNHGPGIDEVLSVSRGGNTSYFQADVLGSIVREVEGTTVKASYEYDTFGKLLSTTGNPGAPYGFQGREFDSESGLYYFRARYYDAAVGRFISQDPIRFSGGLNFYRFVGNNPNLFRDPNGTQAEWVLPFVGSMVVADGPLPVLDILGGAVFIGAGIYYGPALANQLTKLFNKIEGSGSKEAGTCPNPGDIEGKSPEEIDEIMKEKGWSGEPTREGEGSGVRYPNPTKSGEQVRVMPGKATDPNPVKQGPYGRISKDGKVSDPIPLKGNPTLNR